jgi:pimeloyl-ACP methyl ester carboxylesterase
VTTWVLLRGLTREARHWGRFPDAMCRAMPGARVVAVDLPGFGSRRGERCPARIEEIAEGARAGARLAAAELPVHVLGLSLGAMVAVEWSRARPGEVSACVLVNASLGTLSAFHQRLRPRNYAHLVRLALPGLDDRERESAIVRLTSSRGDPEGTIAGAWAAYRRDRPFSPGNAWRQLVAAARYAGSRSPPPVPALVLASEGDRLVDPACSRAIAASWGVPIEVHPRAGHDLPLDDGAWVAERVSEWISRR